MQRKKELKRYKQALKEQIDRDFKGKKNYTADLMKQVT